MAAIDTSSRRADAKGSALSSRVLQWLLGPRLSWHFAIPGVVLVLLVGLAVVLVIVRETATALENGALEETKRDATWDAGELPSLLTAQQLTAPVSSAEYTAVDQVIQAHVKRPGVERINIWSPSGQVLYSDEPSLVGQTFPFGDTLASAFHGEATAQTSTLEGAEDTWQTGQGRLLEVYTPVRLPNSPEVVAVLEVYSDYSVVAARIAQTQRTIYIAFAAGIVVIYVILFGVHRWGASIIGRQRDEVLTQRNRLLDEVGERERAEVELRESETTYRDLVENLNEVVYAQDKDGRITYISPAVERVSGFTPSEVIGRSFTEFIHPEDLPSRMATFQKAISGSLEPSEHRILSRSGEIRWMHTSSRPVFDGDRIVGLRAVAFDITDRKRAEAELREHEETYRDLVENINEVIYALDANGLVTYVSPAVERIGGFTPSEVIGRSFTEFIYPEDLPSLMASFQKTISGSLEPSEFRTLSRSGEIRWVRTSSRPVFDGDRIVGLRAVLMDITDRKRAETELRESETKFRTLSETIAAAAFIFQGTRIRYVNHTAQALTGYSRQELGAMNFGDVIHPDDRELVRERGLARQRGEQVPPRYEVKIVTKRGEPRWVDFMAGRIEFDGAPAVLGTAFDITDRKRAEDALSGSEAKSRALLDAIPDLMCRLRLDGTFLDFKAARDVDLRVTADQLLGRNVAEVLPSDVTPLVMHYVERAHQEGEIQVFEYQHVLNGSPRYFEARIVVSGEDEVLAIVRDITARKTAEDQIKYQAYHDALTGLPNRALFKDRLTMALAQARRRGETLAVMFLDLDRFKLVNDTVGHAVGDQVLQAAAERLAGLLRDVDTVARVGGDEFALLLRDISGLDDLREAATRILEGLRPAWLLAGQEFHITASIGVALYPDDGDDEETLLRNADTALYRAKDDGMNNFQLFTPAMNTRLLERVALEKDVRRALERQEFVVHYQPQVDIETGQIVGTEALVRWRHPELGLVAPMEFIPLAEETGLIGRLGEWVLRTACAQNKEWQDAGLPEIRMAVNLSALQFQQADLIALIERVLNETGLAPDYLELEITEGTAMRDVEFTISVLKALREMGVHVAIDDFGTGYSSLSYLKRFPIDDVKIDRSFVRDLTVDPDDDAIVAAIIGLARALNLTTIAEGVETEAQLAFLKECRCHQMQGFLVSRAVPAEELKKMLGRKALAVSAVPGASGRSL